MSGTPQLIPTQPGLQVFSVALNEASYNMRIMWNDVAPDPFYALDISPIAGGTFADGSSLLAGLPLLPGADLLSQFEHLGIGGQLFVLTDRGAGENPTYEGLGVTSRIYFVPDA